MTQMTKMNKATQTKTITEGTINIIKAIKTMTNAKINKAIMEGKAKEVRVTDAVGTVTAEAIQAAAEAV